MIDDTGNGGIELRPDSPKPAKARSHRGSGRRKPATPTEAIAQVAVAASQEIEAFGSAIELAQSAWVDDQAARILDGVADAPNQVVSALIDKAGGYAADAESFRARGIEFGATLFPAVGAG